MNLLRYALLVDSTASPLPDTIMEFYHTFRTMQPVHPLLLSEDKAPELDAIITAFLKIVSEDSTTMLKLGYLHIFLSYLF